MESTEHLFQMLVNGRNDVRSLVIAWLRDRMSTQIVISFGFDGLGTATIGDTQGVGPSARSMMSSFSSCLLLVFYLLLYMERDAVVRLRHWSDRFICIYAYWSPLYSPIQLSKRGKSLRTSGLGRLLFS